MGVKGLQFYMENCCRSASPDVNISQLVSQHRRQSGRTNEQLLIVVDGSNCIRQLYGDLEWIGGAQLKQFGDNARKFVDAFNHINVRLVFFFDGPTFEDKRRTWIERRLQTVDKIYEVLDAIAKGTPSKQIPKRNFHLPPGMGQLSRVVFEVICGCKVYQSVKDCDKEIAEYARVHHAFAILAQDTDYVIMDSGSALYLSMNHLDLDTMRTKLYDRFALARSLRIDTSQLPLLATFMGNDIIPAADLKRFHHELTNQRNPEKGVNFAAVVPKIADFIRSLPYRWDYFYNELPQISLRVLRSDRSRDIETSIESYDTQIERDPDEEERGDPRSPWQSLLVEVRQRHVNNQLPSMVYAIMKGLPFESSSSVEDYRTRDLPTFASVTEPIRARIYGILLAEKPLPRSGFHEVKEWCMAGPGSLDEPKFVQAESPSRPHPGLRVLWDDPACQTLRWQLFVHSVSPQLDVERIRSTLPGYLVVPTLILFLLNEQGCLSQWEIDAMLATAVCIKNYNTDMLAGLRSDPLQPRGIRVANLIMRCTFVLYFLLAACGFPLSIRESAPWLFFDGKLFQEKYAMASDPKASDGRLCEHRVTDLEHFQLARRLI